MGDDCDWSQAVSVVGNSIALCGDNNATCTNGDTVYGKVSTMTLCGPNMPQGKDSPVGNWVVTYSLDQCSGNPDYKSWHADGRCVATLDSTSEMRTCIDNQIHKSTYNGYVCGGPATSFNFTTGCDETGGGSGTTSYTCGLKASPASTLLVSTMLMVIALALAL